ncbi:MAG: hypothetical protein KAH38_12650, partial [Candidatus Hydrogenedentes bacterium]|nr:hypothetical protein [Candidatus Hydrogenedentota bacterium]
METFHYNDDKFRYFPYDIPIMDRARKQFEIDTLDTSKGQDAPFRFARTLAARMNEGCDFSTSTASPARSGELLAIMLLHEISHHLIRSYCRKVNPNTIENALSHVRKTRGVETVNNM